MQPDIMTVRFRKSSWIILENIYSPDSLSYTKERGAKGDKGGAGATGLATGG